MSPIFPCRIHVPKLKPKYRLRFKELLNTAVHEPMGELPWSGWPVGKCYVKLFIKLNCMTLKEGRKDILTNVLLDMQCLERKKENIRFSQLKCLGHRFALWILKWNHTLQQYWYCCSWLCCYKICCGIWWHQLHFHCHCLLSDRITIQRAASWQNC